MFLLPLESPSCLCFDSRSEVRRREVGLLSLYAAASNCGLEIRTLSNTWLVLIASFHLVLKSNPSKVPCFRR